MKALGIALTTMALAFTVGCSQSADPHANCDHDSDAHGAPAAHDPNDGGDHSGHGHDAPAALSADVLKTDAASIAAAKPYPLKTCVVSGDALDAAGEPYVVAFEGQQIAFCCKPCVKKFLKNSAHYMAMIQKPAGAALPEASAPAEGSAH